MIASLSTTVLQPARVSVVRPPDAAAGARWPVWVARAAVAAVLAVHVPAFLCMGLDSDVSMWDLCARNVLRGGVAYRDAVENNLPGMFWLHLAIRSVCGWGPVAMRLADLVVVTGIVWLLLRWLPAGGALPAATAALLFSFYLSTNEWCHCQRDMWMLLPALLALALRGRQVARLGGGSRSVVGWGFVEGVCWAAAFWIKPFVAVPALLCWLTSVVLVSRSKGHTAEIATDATGLLAGGLTVGTAGVAWLVGSGAWPAFVDIVVGWNREYVADCYTAERLALLAGVLVRFLPWSLVHLIAVPVAIEQLWLASGGRKPPESAAPSGGLRPPLANLRPPLANSRRTALLSALYLGWLLQAVWLQQVFDYIHTPAVLLGLALVAARWPTLDALPRWSVAACVAACLAMQQSSLVSQRLGLWSRCLREGGTAELRDRLALNDRTGWRELEQVADFLRRQGALDGEVTCYTVRTLPLYAALNIGPSTRYYALESTLTLFARHRAAIRAELAASRQKYVVCDLYWMRRTEAELTRSEGKARTLLNTGRYVVLRLDAADTPAWLASSFGL